MWVNPNRLRVVREARARTLGLGSEIDYLDPELVKDEVRAAQRIMRGHGWRIIDASYMAVEEIARDVLRMLAEK